ASRTAGMVWVDPAEGRRVNRGHDMPRGILIGAVAGMVGCGSSQHSTGTAGFTRTDSGAVVRVLLDEDRIHMPTTIPSGDITFEGSNAGAHRPNIEIRGPGVDAALPKDLEAGESAQLKVRLEPGAYKVRCPVGPHAALGMRLDLTVQR